MAAYKHSENGNEKDKAVLVCVSHGYPLPTDWTWFKEEDGVRNVGLPECLLSYLATLAHKPVFYYHGNTVTVNLWL